MMEQTQPFSSVKDNEPTPPSDSREEDTESPVSRYHSKIVVLITGKPWTPASSPLITVNIKVWRHLPEQESTWWGYMGRIIPIKGTIQWFIKIVTPDIAKAIKRAKTELRLSADEELIKFYSKD